MKTSSNYRYQLLQVAVLLRLTIEDLLTAGFNIELYDDLRSGILSFEEEEELPLDPKLLQVSENPAVHAIFESIKLTDHCISSLMNINALQEEDIARYAENTHPDHSAFPYLEAEEALPYSYWLRETFDYMNLQIFFMLQHCYCMRYEVTEVPDEVIPGICFPGPESEALLLPSDINIQLIFDLTRQLCDRNSIIDEYDFFIKRK